MRILQCAENIGCLSIQTGAIILIKSCPRYSHILLYAEAGENNRKKTGRVKF